MVVELAAVVAGVDVNQPRARDFDEAVPMPAERGVPGIEADAHALIERLQDLRELVGMTADEVRQGRFDDERQSVVRAAIGEPGETLLTVAQPGADVGIVPRQIARMDDDQRSAEALERPPGAENGADWEVAMRRVMRLWASSARDLPSPGIFRY
jgi:hypothetical protein